MLLLDIVRVWCIGSALSIGSIGETVVSCICEAAASEDLEALLMWYLCMGVESSGFPMRSAAVTSPPTSTICLRIALSQALSSSPSGRTINVFDTMLLSAVFLIPTLENSEPAWETATPSTSTSCITWAT